MDGPVLDVILCRSEIQDGHHCSTWFLHRAKCIFFSQKLEIWLNPNCTLATITGQSFNIGPKEKIILASQFNIVIIILQEDIVKLQIINLAAKLCITNPKQTKLLCQYVFNLAKYDQNYDIRDRCRFLRQMILPGEKASALAKYAKKIFLSTKPAPVLESKFKGKYCYNLHKAYQGPSWPWSYGSWIYNYLCNQCLSPLMLWESSR